MYFVFFFFFQAEDGIRDLTVTGVQTCALPISYRPAGRGWVGVQADFDRATDELSRILAVERGRLRPETVALLERNLAVIDAAIAEARAAPARDPADADLRRLFGAAARHKGELVRWG